MNIRYKPKKCLGFYYNKATGAVIKVIDSRTTRSATFDTYTTCDSEKEQLMKRSELVKHYTKMTLPSAKPANYKPLSGKF